jgi:transcriptional regulator with GAF, ATPase, and Fis domain
MNTVNPIITRNAGMLSVLSRLEAAARSDAAVLLIGETGVGKELLAEFVHSNSYRSAKTFVKVGLAALPRELLESELFGHEKGAYTHAISQKKGLFEISDGGSIFLDDIDDFPLDLQAKLLRVLESHELMRIGSTTPIRVDTRLISATKIDLKEMIARKTFRADLYYRIDGFPVTIPPLRERTDDIPLLVDNFLQQFAPGRKLALSPAACSAMAGYRWSGNVRELRNVMQSVCLFAKDIIEESDLPSEIRGEPALASIHEKCQECLVANGMSFDQVVSCLERNLLEQALAESAGNQSQAARALKMSISTLRDKLHKHSLS